MDKEFIINTLLQKRYRTSLKMLLSDDLFNERDYEWLRAGEVVTGNETRLFSNVVVDAKGDLHLVNKMTDEHFILNVSDAGKPFSNSTVTAGSLISFVTREVEKRLEVIND